MYLSVIIPAYNEEKRLSKTLNSIDNYLKKQNYEYEILVVDNGSKDKTVEIVNQLFSQIRGLRLVKGSSNQGKGFAVKIGILESKGDFRVFTDADNSTSLDQIEKMWPEFKSGFDVVIGSRDIKGAVIPVPQPWWRRRLGDIFNLIVQIFSGIFGIWDTQCGFKGFRAEAAENIFKKTKISGFAFDVEVLILAKKMGYKIKEIPITWINDADSKVKLNGMIKMLIEVLKIRLNLIFKKYEK